MLTWHTVYRPNTRAKSDADILRDAKLEAMGLLPEDHSPPRQNRSNHDRPQMATDEIVSRGTLFPTTFLTFFQVMERFKKRMRK